MSREKNIKRGTAMLDKQEKELKRKRKKGERLNNHFQKQRKKKTKDQNSRVELMSYIKIKKSKKAWEGGREGGRHSRPVTLHWTTSWKTLPES